MGRRRWRRRWRRRRGGWRRWWRGEGGLGKEVEAAVAAKRAYNGWTRGNGSFRGGRDATPPRAYGGSSGTLRDPPQRSRHSRHNSHAAAAGSGMGRRMCSAPPAPASTSTALWPGELAVVGAAEVSAPSPPLICRCTSNFDFFLCFLPVRPMPPLSRGIKVHLHADRLHVSEQGLDTDMEHAKIHVCAAVAARACASMQRARYLWLAPSTDSDSCSHLFCQQNVKRHQGTDFSSICRKEFDLKKTPS